MKTLNLKKLNVPKVVVLATGLTAAVLVGTMSPQAANAYSSNPPMSSCAGCHSNGTITPGTTAIAPTTTLAPNASYSVTVTPVANPAGGRSGYSIVPVAPATGSTNATGTAPFTATMTAPATTGTFTYTVWTNQGPSGAGVAGTATYTITVGTTTTTTPPVTTTTTTPPVTTTTTTPPVTTTTTAPPVTTTTAPPVTTTTEPPVTTTTEPPVTTTTEPPVTTTTEPPVTTTTEPPVTTTNTPGSPTNVKATAGNAQATVSWDAPKDDGGMPIVGYIVIANDGGVLAPTKGTETTMTMTGLTNGKSYTFTVVAFNEGENFGSEASAASNAVTPVGPAASATATTPVVAGSSAVIPVGAPDTGAGGTSGSNNGPMAGLGGLALLMAGAGATQVVRRRRQV